MLTNLLLGRLKDAGVVDEHVDPSAVCRAADEVLAAGGLLISLSFLPARGEGWGEGLELIYACPVAGVIW